MTYFPLGKTYRDNFAKETQDLKHIEHQFSDYVATVKGTLDKKQSELEKGKYCYII
jgi:hypothetical protein